MLETVGHAIVDVLPLYETDFCDILKAKDLEDFRNKGADAIIFTSSSTALSYIEQEEDLILEKTAQKPVFFSFGPETSKTLKENNLAVAAESDQPNMNSMVKVLISYFNQ